MTTNTIGLIVHFTCFLGTGMAASSNATMGGVAAVAFFAIALIVFTIVRKTIRTSGLFGPRSSAVVAACVSLLCAIALLRSVGGQSGVNDSGADERSVERDSDFITVPFATLALSILMCPIAFALVKFGRCARRFIKFLRRSMPVWWHGQSDDSHKTPTNTDVDVKNPESRVGNRRTKIGK